MRYPGIFLNQHTGLGVQKTEQWNVSKAGFLKRSLLSQVYYGRRKRKRFHEKTCKSSLSLHTPWLLTFQHAKGDHWKQLRPFIRDSKLLIPIRNSYWEKNGLLSKFYMFTFSVEKKINQLIGGYIGHNASKHKNK